MILETSVLNLKVGNNITQKKDVEADFWSNQQKENLILIDSQKQYHCFLSWDLELTENNPSCQYVRLFLLSAVNPP